MPLPNVFNAQNRNPNDRQRPQPPNPVGGRMGGAASQSAGPMGNRPVFSQMGPDNGQHGGPRRYLTPESGAINQSQFEPPKSNNPPQPQPYGGRNTHPGQRRQGPPRGPVGPMQQGSYPPPQPQPNPFMPNAPQVQIPQGPGPMGTNIFSQLRQQFGQGAGPPPQQPPPQQPPGNYPNPGLPPVGFGGQGRGGQPFGPNPYQLNPNQGQVNPAQPRPGQMQPMPWAPNQGGR